MKQYTGKHNKKELPELDSLQQELKRERYKRRFRRLLRSTVNALIVVAAVAALVATLILPVLQNCRYQHGAQPEGWKHRAAGEEKQSENR